MDLESFRRSPIGELVSIVIPAARPGLESTSYFAFVPTPLPDEPAIDMEAVDLASRAAMAVARLDQAMGQLPNPQLLLRPIIRREAVSTSALEGTYAPFDEVLEADFLEENQLSAPQREIQNFVRAVEESRLLLENRPISRNVISKLQQIIVRGTPGDTYQAGDIRQAQVFIGARSRDIAQARFVPPPPGQFYLEAGVYEWEKWVSSPKPMPIVLRMALAHYQFETLHPYNDGNGRLGRLIALMQLVEDGVLKMPSLNISPWLEARRDEYIDGLLEVSKTGDFNPWVKFFSRAVLEQAEDGIRAIAELIEFRDSTIEKLRHQNVRGSALQIVENLTGYPVIDVPTARRLTGKTFEAANQAVARLVEEGVLREITGRKMNRLFVCPGIMRIININTAY
ncbi:Fic family protein [Amycolatopsis sp. NBC_00345]|uniref:Fic family protein n=1 Tax=Amycolatopsis sp. NBC_00345 TaxID=2975955 RepID=UPI002E26A25A